MTRNEFLKEHLTEIQLRAETVCRRVGWTEQDLQRWERDGREAFETLAPTIEEGAINLLMRAAACLEFLEPAQK